MALPPLLAVPQIHARLQIIFPEGSPNRSKCTWEIAELAVRDVVHGREVKNKEALELFRGLQEQGRSAPGACRWESLKIGNSEVAYRNLPSI